MTDLGTSMKSGTGILPVRLRGIGVPPMLHGRDAHAAKKGLLIPSLRQHHGVTLVEILVVLGIIVVLSGIVITVTLRVDTQSKENTLRSTFALLGSALREYYEFKGQFPPQPERNAANALTHVETMMQELRSVPAARQILDKVSLALIRNEGGPLDAQSVRDPWGTVLDYIYTPDNTLPELISAGPDRQFGTGDDISSKGQR